MQRNPEVSILMCTFNGEKYLPEQLDSFLKQTHQNWGLWVSDDGSLDATKTILNDFFKNHKIFGEMIEGPRNGFCKNFLSLINNKKISSKFYALADQDDVWFPEKIEKAVNWLRNIHAETPALFCTRTRLVDADKNFIGYSPLFQNKASFENALVQNIAGGNTMVFNEAAMKLIREAGPDIDVPVHDWWVYLLVTASGGVVFYDQTPSLDYRQHGSNLIGNATGYKALLSKVKSFCDNSFPQWIDRNINSLLRVSSRVTSENLRKIVIFREMRSQNFLKRLNSKRILGLYRLTKKGQLALWAGVFLNRV